MMKARQAIEGLLEAIELQALDPRDVVRMCLCYMTNEDVLEMVRINDLQELLLSLQATE